MRKGVFACILVLAASALAAQGPPDFTGVYLLHPEARPQRKAKADKRATSRGNSRALEFVEAMDRIEESIEAGSPLVLTVNQSEDTLEVTRHQNGITSTIQYNLKGRETRNRGPWGLVTRDRANLKKRKLVIESTVEAGGLGGFDVTGNSLAYPANGQRIKETWELQPDAQTLRIRSTFPLYSGGAGFEPYSRQASLEAALAKADAASLMKKCSNLMRPPIQQGATKYDDGVRIGSTAYRQLGRCVELDARLRGESLSGLERTAESGVAQFRKNGKTVSEYPDFVVL